MEKFALSFIVFAAIALSTSIASAEWLTVSGTIQEIMSCSDDSDASVGLIVVDNKWLEISRSDEEALKANFSVAMAAFLSGRNVWLKVVLYSDPPSRCRTFPVGRVIVGNDYSRMKITSD